LMGAPHNILKKAVEQPKPDRTGPLPRALKIEITGGYGSGKEKMARMIRDMLKRELSYRDRVTVQVRLPDDGTETLLPNGEMEKRIEGPDDATFLIVAIQGDPQ